MTNETLRIETFFDDVNGWGPRYVTAQADRLADVLAQARNMISEFKASVFYENAMDLLSWDGMKADQIPDEAEIVVRGDQFTFQLNRHAGGGNGSCITRSMSVSAILKGNQLPLKLAA